MSLVQNYHQSQGGPFQVGSRSYYGRNSDTSTSSAVTAAAYYNHYNLNYSHLRNHNSQHEPSRNYRDYKYNLNNCSNPEAPSSFKRRKFSSSPWEDNGSTYPIPYSYDNVPSNLPNVYTNTNYPVSTSTVYNNSRSTCESHSAVTATTKPDANAHTSTSFKRDRSTFEEEDDLVFLSRDEIERRSPSRKDGIDAIHETHLRYSYCAFLQNLGIQLELPQTTIGTAMVLCHRFFIRRSHACHDRFLVATAALFLAAKSEETACPLNNVLRLSCEFIHNKDFTFLSYMLPVDWFEQYRERVIEAEQMILTTLNFELNVQHPYATLTSTLEKLGFSHTVLVNLALSLVSEGLRSSLWLQFKPHQIAAGAAYLSAKFLNMDLVSYHNVWKEFETPPSVLKDVAQQLMELF